MEFRKFSKIDLSDPFFDSLKSDYTEFTIWFNKKAKIGESAFIINSDEGIEAFLYLKLEEEELSDLMPPMPRKKRLKIGTLKVNPHGTRLGERLIKKTFDYAIATAIEEIYVTVFAKHEYLIALFKKYGFCRAAKKTTHNGIEEVYLKDFNQINNDIYLDYPKIKLDSKKYLLAIYPVFHTRLLPDSKLYNEKFDIIKDVSHTNSIHKIYICRMQDVAALKKNDLVVIYRTGDGKGPAKYRAVATSVCAIEEVKQKSDFNSIKDYLDYCKTYSVFEINELKEWYKFNELFVIRFTYNFALNKRIIRDLLINEVGLESNRYWGFFELSNDEFSKIIKLGEVDEGFIIH